MILSLLLLSGCLPNMNPSGLKFSIGSDKKEKLDPTLTPFDQLMKNHCIECHVETFKDPVLFDEWMRGETPEDTEIFYNVESGRMPKRRDPLPLSDLEIIRERVSRYQVFEKILEPKCLECHQKTFEDPERFGRWIVPGRPEESKLYLSVKNGTMPKGKDRLSESELRVLENYITNLR